jgi:hypothetical protein
MATAFQGHDGLRRFFAEWLQAFPDSSVEVEDVEQPNLIGDEAPHLALSY